MQEAQNHSLQIRITEVHLVLGTLFEVITQSCSMHAISGRRELIFAQVCQEI